jgi:hypothetical protein
MFHYKDTNLATKTDRRLIRSTFSKYSTAQDKQTVNKSDFKASWLFLFGYKPSKVSVSFKTVGSSLDPALNEFRILLKYEVEQIFTSYGKDYYKSGLTSSEFEECTIANLKRLVSAG